MHNGPQQRPNTHGNPGFYNRKTTEAFTSLNKIGYVADPYERKQDLERGEYAKNNAKILHRNLPFASTVKQRGTFFPNYKTYGTAIDFPNKQLPGKKQPLFGPFKKGDPLHHSYNKTIGGHGRSTEYEYKEEMEQDHVKY